MRGMVRVLGRWSLCCVVFLFYFVEYHSLVFVGSRSRSMILNFFLANEKGWMPLTTYSTHREGLPVPPVPRYEEKEPNALRRTTIQAAALAGSIISRRNVRKDNLLEGIVRKSSHVVLYYYVWIIIFYCTDDTNFFFNHQIYKVVNSAIKSLECAADISQVNVT
jgi:hypothetical protein